MRVALFITCLTDTFYPRVGEAVVRVLRHFGCEVEFPAEQTCCGQPAFNSGFCDAAKPLARRLIEIFEPYEHVVTPSASCATMLKDHYAELLADEAEWATAAQRLAHKTHEFATFLRDRIAVDIADHVRFNEPVTYHYPCHARGVYTVADLCGWLAGEGNRVQPPPHADLCCGFGGMFAVDFPEISGAMLEDKLDDLVASGARLVICNEGGCGLNLAGGARRRELDLRFKHLAECLAESLGLMEPEG